jgi:thiol-disulfide isomerase/thioredoxin
MRGATARVLAVALSWLCLAVAPTRAEDVLGIEALADEVPRLALVSAEGGTPLANADLAGKTVLLHFWATWCAPCKEELPALESLAAGLDPARFAVVLVAIDDNLAAVEVLAYARNLGVSLPVYVASAGGVSDSFWGWGLPVSHLIDAQGQFIGRLRGPRPWRDGAVRQALLALQRP